MRHDVGMSSHLIDFHIRETIGLRSEQLATSGNRYRLGVHVVIVFHGRSTSEPQNEQSCPGNVRAPARRRIRPTRWISRADVGAGPTSITVNNAAPMLMAEGNRRSPSTRRGGAILRATNGNQARGTGQRNQYSPIVAFGHPLHFRLPRAEKTRGVHHVEPRGIAKRQSRHRSANGCSGGARASAQPSQGNSPGEHR